MSAESASENWRSIAGFPGYEVSDLGRVLSRKSGKPRLLRGTANEKGYRSVQFWMDGRYSHRLVHVLVLEAFVGHRPEGMETRHLNGRRADNRLTNLRWGTRAENIEDIARHGTHHNAVKTACPQGHPYDAHNTYIKPAQSGRICRACGRERYRRERELAASHHSLETTA